MSIGRTVTLWWVEHIYWQVMSCNFPLFSVHHLHFLCADFAIRHSVQCAPPPQFSGEPGNEMQPPREGVQHVIHQSIPHTPWASHATASPIAANTGSSLLSVAREQQVLTHTGTQICETTAKLPCRKANPVGDQTPHQTKSWRRRTPMHR